VWSEGAPIVPAATIFMFGTTVAISPEHLAGGAQDDGSGTVYVYDRVAAGWGNEHLLQTADAQAGDSFGSALAFTSNLLFVGASSAAVEDGTYAGRVQAFALGGTWQEQGRISPSTASDGLTFGSAIATAPGSAVLVRASVSAFAYAQPLGAACSADSGCGSEHCAEGVCCENACSDLCHSCKAELQAGEAPQDGLCRSIAANKNAREGGCPASLDPCGRTGFCDGVGACAVSAGMPQ